MSSDVVATIGDAPRLTTAEAYALRVSALHRMIDEGTEPTDEEITSIAVHAQPDLERDIAQLFYRRALVAEDRLERELDAEFEQRRQRARLDDDINAIDSDPT